MAMTRKHVTISRKLAASRISEMLKVSERAESDPSQWQLFKVQVSLVDSVYADFCKSHIELLTLCEDEEFDIEDAVRKTVDDQYHTIKHRCDILLSTMTNLTVKHPETNAVRLPKLELLKFAGELSDWQAYIDVFDNSVHKRTDISDVHKFQYLLSTLAGEPLTLIKAISLSSANYLTAYDTLVKRFSNKRLITLSHWRELKNFPVLTNADPKRLRHLVDTFSKNLSVLRNLEFDVEAWDFPITDMILDKLDAKTRERFELNSDPATIPTYMEVHHFLSKQCIALEAVNSSKTVSKPYENQPKPVIRFKNVVSHVAKVSTDSEQCTICNQSHKIFLCPTFKRKNVQERIDIIKTADRCYNCFRTGHRSNQCQTSQTCRECHKRHHTLLHVQVMQKPAVAAIQEKPPLKNDGNNLNRVTSCNSTVTHSTTTTLLATTLLVIKDRNGTDHVLRALIDSGSQASFIIRKCVNRLQLPISPYQSPVFGLGNISSSVSLGAVRCELKPCRSTQPSVIVDAIVLPQICSNLPSVPLKKSMWKMRTDFPLADPKWYQPGGVDMLIGADIYPFILLSGVLPAVNSQPMALQTIFGWTLIGPVQTNRPTTIQSFVASLDQSPNTITKFWEIEEVPQKKLVHPDDEQAERMFQTTLVRHPNGRFEVTLPFKVDHPTFPSSKSVAQRRFFSLERRLATDEPLRTLYHEFMTDYLTSGHMTELSHIPSATDCYFIPHHAVMKVENGKSKLRVVFDASAKTEYQPSLNDTLHIGPKLQNDISTILLRFRTKAFVLTCDIRQMYRQILISPTHRRYQLIWWRFSIDGPLRAYQLNTVTYGISSSPFLAIRTLQHLSSIEQNRFPLAFRVLSESLYVDDIICGADSLEEASEIQRQLIELLKLGGFELRKWSSNSPELLQNIPPDHRQGLDLPFDNQDHILKILGLQWRANIDSFVFRVNPTNVNCTKRSILSQIARVYDPLGFICPLSFYAKVLIQKLWIAGSNWDDPAPDEICHQWKRFIEELPSLSNLSIPRMITVPNQTNCQLHAFCDASSAGYATVIYLRITDDHDVTNVKFVTAKSKVAPIKSLSIPRLELCAAVLLSNLVEFVLHSFQNVINISNVHAWSDSQVVLSWIRSFPNRFKPFVSNRVAYIQERVSPDCWHYVPSSHNPADIPSRGCLPEELLRATLWWAGPSWLGSHHNEWPTNIQSEMKDDSSMASSSTEEKVVALIHTSSPHLLDMLLNRLSKFRKIQRSLAFCRRFLHNCRCPHNKDTGPLSDLELDESLTMLIRHTQSQFFEAEISLLKRQKSCPKWLAGLSPFIDDHGILRVGGRLDHAMIEFAAKHPALLPKKGPLTHLIVRHIHESSCHAGVHTTMYLAQQRFWILSARTVIRSILNKCYRCFRTNPSSYQPLMANLPPSRVTINKPFSCVGVDYGGPFSTIYRRHRGTKSFKIYLCLFVCFSTKAIHIEIANDLSTEAFLGALRRFVARRGRCSQIYSDRGTNFVGAARLMNNYLHQASVGESIQWIFNPPGAPHFGGIWEAGIKSVKTHLNRVVGHQTLTYEEFLTLVTQIESLLNSRPLTPISSDPKDLSVLSPGHFLTMEPMSSFPEPVITSTKLSLLSRWQLVQHLHQSFWSRWSREYLHTLHQRAKWRNDGNPSSPVVGAMVLIKTEQCPPLQWHIGRITELHPGKDNVARVATILTSNGIITRPLVKLCPLPMA